MENFHNQILLDDYLGTLPEKSFTYLSLNMLSGKDTEYLNVTPTVYLISKTNHNL